MNARDSGCDFSNSLFQTGSGKVVNVSSEGLARAKTLLGLHEDNNQCGFQDFQDTRNLPNGNSRFGWQNASNEETSKSVNHYGIVDDAVSRSLSTSSVDLGQNSLKNEAKPHLIQSKMQDSSTKPPPVKFHTAGGRSISVSSDALKRAKSLLGDPELGTFLDAGDADVAFSFSKKKETVDPSLNKENVPLTSLSHHEMATGMLMCKSFVSPLRSSSKQMLAPATSESLHSGTNLMGQFDAVSHDNAYRLNGTLACQQQPLSNNLVTQNTVVDNSTENGIGIRKTLGGKTLGRQLVDISNTIGTTEKRRILGASVSPFKRPRSSKFSTPMKSNVSFAPNGK